jgi:hypothetical protein
VRFGTKCPDGFLPIFSVNSEEEAKRLLVAACSRNRDNEFIANELAEEQTLDNLYAFGDRLREIYARIKKDEPKASKRRKKK